MNRSRGRMLRGGRRIAVAGACGAALAGLAPDLQAGPQEDAYLAGYVQAVVDRDPAWVQVRVEAHDGYITVRYATDPRLPAEKLTQLEQVISTVRGVRTVNVIPLPAVTVETATPVVPSSSAAGPVSPPAAIDAGAGTPPALPQAAPTNPDATVATTTPPPTMALWPAPIPLGQSVAFPRDRLFDPLLADPRWPHFAASYQSYQGENLNDVAAVSFGETISMVRWNAPFDLPGQVEFVLQPGVFAVFDLDGESADLLDADYFIGGGLAWRSGPWSALVRIYHESTHLGDEYILNNGITPEQRLNLSYEMLHVLVSYDVRDDGTVRIYGGGGVLFDTDPNALGKETVEYGMELRSPMRVLGGRAVPVAAVDVKHWDFNDWNADVSLRGGLEFSDPLKGKTGSRILILVEYFNGHNPNGQFFPESIRSIGAGVHVYY